MNQDTIEELAPAETLQSMLPDPMIIQLIYVAAKLRLADLMRDGPKHVSELAAATETDAQALFRLLRALASIRVFAEGESRVFELTPIARLLRTDIPESMHLYAMWYGEPWNWRPTGELLHSIRTGQTAFDYVFGMGHYDYLEQDESANALFQQGMGGRTIRESQIIVDAYDFSQARTVVDIGGGGGELLEAILTSYPMLKGVLFDLPEVVEIARDRLGSTSLTERIAFETGSFFDRVPEAGNIYLLKYVLHNWDDTKAVEILSACRRAMGVDGRLLILESVIPPGNDPHEGKILDVTMLALLGGRERSQPEYESLLEQAGLRLRQIVPTGTYLDVVEATRV